MAGSAATRGVGLRIGIPAALYLSFAVLIAWVFRPAFDIPGLSHVWLFVAGCVWLAAGLALFALSVQQLLAAMLDDGLATEGPFSVVANPMYAIGIVFLAPGIALMAGTWPALLAPAVTFVLFRIFIREEETALREKFGEAYEAYRKRVLVKFL
jgi:protein-S-isoprenylcysteine O-methyltransferase Ste14